MAKVRVTKEFSFEMAHALWNYDGPCKNIHGHSYKLFVTVIGEPLNDVIDVKNGMVIDFGDLKRIVNKEIVAVFDHSVVMSKDAGYSKSQDVLDFVGNLQLLDYQPTCENLVVDFAERIKKHLPNSISLHSITLYETATSKAEWHASDNE